MCKNKQWIFNLIALIILLTGMCVDEVKADSVFLCPGTAVITESGTAAGVNQGTIDAVISNVSVEPKELLCTRNSITSSQIAAQIVNCRRSIKLSIVFLCVAVFSLLLSNFYTVERVEEFPRLSERTAVLNYIHNTDGKK